jgi:hypothetical protein
MFTPGFTGPTLLEGWAASHGYRTITFSGPPFQTVRRTSCYPLSLAATHGVSVDFLSSGY